MPAKFCLTNPFSSYFPYISDEQMQALAVAYPDDITQVSDYIMVSKSIHAWLWYCWQGSPFNTGTANAITFVLYLKLCRVCRPHPFRFQSRIQKDCRYTRWQELPSSTALLPWGCLQDAANLLFPWAKYFILFVFFITRIVGYVRGTSTPVFGASHGSDIAELFGLSKNTDFILADAISKNFLLIPRIPS